MLDAPGANGFIFNTWMRHSGTPRRRAISSLRREWLGLAQARNSAERSNRNAGARCAGWQLRTRAVINSAFMSKFPDREWGPASIHCCGSMRLSVQYLGTKADL
jgi:hypothetical protein